jgi:oligopeptide/dipeptide ABC transporter ATP-binding protein
MAYFEVNDLTVDYKTFGRSKRVLDIDHIKIEKGATFGVVGESGQGKTVLALSVLKLLRCPPGEIVKGEVLLDGQNILRYSQYKMQREVRGKKIAMIFQDPMSCLNPVFIIGDQMRNVISQNRGLKGKKALSYAMDILSQVRLSDPEETLGKYPHQLSGGQRQRVIIALALCCGAEFLIADEPTRNLDATIQAGILKLLRELQTTLGMTVLFIANNMSLVSAFCDRTGILRDGEIIEQGATEQIIGNPQREYTKLLIDAARFDQGNPEDSGSDETLLKVSHLKKYFEVTRGFADKKERLKAVDDVSFELKKGDVLGIVGESGCGKSTLVNTILNLFEPTEGDVWFDGQNVFTSRSKASAYKKNVQIVFQDPFWSLNPRWLVKDIVAEPIDAFGAIYGRKRLNRVEELLEMVGLSRDDMYKYPHEFSGGQRQRIAIARSLALNPKLVVLYEPTSSIDVFSQAQILKLLRKLKDDFRLTNILISHDLGVVGQMANKIAVMYLGKVVEFGPAKNVFSAPRHHYTMALFNSIPRLGVMGVENLSTLEGTIPSPINPPSGCSFHTRCAAAREECVSWTPRPIYVGPEHYVCCLCYEDMDIRRDEKCPVKKQPPL